MVRQTGLTLLLLLLAQGCEEQAAPTLDAAPPRDVTQGRNCGDVGVYNWSAEVQAVAGVGDAGESATLFSIWGLSDTAVWAVGTKGKILFYNGTTWQAQESPTEVTLTGVWGVSETDVWAVGLEGTVVHYDGVAWTLQSPPVAVFYTGDGGPPTGDAAAELRRNLWGVWARGNATTGTAEVFAVGDNGTVIHYDGVTKIWSDKIPVAAGGKNVRIQDQLSGVWGAGNKVYIVGNFGTILEGNKAGLAVQQTGVTKDLHAVWGRSDNDVYAVGTGGTVLHRRGGSWKERAGAPKQVLRGVWGPQNDSSVVYMVGWDGTLLRVTGGPGYGKGAQFDPYYCIIPGRRLESIWGTLVPITQFDASTALDATFTDDASVPRLPLVWAVGASGMVIKGP